MFVSKNERLPGFFRPGTPARHRLSASGVYSKRFLPPAFACWKNYEARRAVIFIRRVVVPALMVPALAFALDACAQLGSNSSSVNTVASADNSAPQSTLLAHHEIKPSNLPPPKLENDVDNPPRVVAQPQGANLNLPPGFETSTFAEGGFQRPRWMALAPNGDVFRSMKVRCFRKSVVAMHLSRCTDPGTARSAPAIRSFASVLRTESPSAAMTISLLAGCSTRTGVKFGVARSVCLSCRTARC